MIILGLVILVAAIVIGVVGVVTNTGTENLAGGEFTVFGFDVTGTTGRLFLVGIIVGAAGMLGLSILLAASRRSARRSKSARRELERTQAAIAVDRDDAAAPTARAESPRTQSGAGAHEQRSWKHPFGGAPHPSH